MMRLVCAAFAIALLSACGEKGAEIVCCAIEPKAKCESALVGLGLSEDEYRLLTGPGRACPSATLTSDRIRELDAKWPASCRESGMMSPLQYVGDDRCPDISLAELEVPIGVDPAKWSACAAGLKARGLKDNELWVMLQHSTEICPNVGVEEPRIREILEKDWDAATCGAVFRKADMLSAIEGGRCGGDAG